MTPLILLLVALVAPSSLAAPSTTLPPSTMLPSSTTLPPSPSLEFYHVCVAMHEDSPPSCFNVTVCYASKTIFYTMVEDDDFTGVTALQDFNVNYGAYCVENEDVEKEDLEEADICYIKKLTTSFTETVAMFQNSTNQVIVSPGDVDIQVVPYVDQEEEDEDKIGQLLLDFCGEKTIMKLEMETAVERQVEVTFRRCLFFLCQYKCYTITITIPTGGSFSFVIG